MRKQNFAPLGLPTLLSILIVLLIFAMTSVTYLSVKQTQASLQKSQSILETSYTLETALDLKLIEINQAYLQAILQENSVETWVKNLNLIQTGEFDVSTSRFFFSLSENPQRIDVVLQLDPQFRSMPIVLQSIHRMDINQDYTQSGDPVYGGQ